MVLNAFIIYHFSHLKVTVQMTRTIAVSLYNCPEQSPLSFPGGPIPHPPTKNMQSFLYTDLWGQAKTPESLPMITNLLMLKDGLIKRFTYKTKLMC